MTTGKLFRIASALWGGAVWLGLWREWDAAFLAGFMVCGVVYLVGAQLADLLERPQ